MSDTPFFTSSQPRQSAFSSTSPSASGGTRFKYISLLKGVTSKSQQGHSGRSKSHTQNAFRTPATTALTDVLQQAAEGGLSGSSTGAGARTGAFGSFSSNRCPINHLSGLAPDVQSQLNSALSLESEAVLRPPADITDALAGPFTASSEDLLVDLLAQLSLSLGVYAPSDPVSSWVAAAPALDRTRSPAVHKLGLTVLSACIHAAPPIKAADVVLYYSSLRAFADDPEERETWELEACVGVLSDLSRGGREVRGLDSATEVLSEWAGVLFRRAEMERQDVATSLGVAPGADSSPLRDLSAKTPFVRLSAARNSKSGPPFYISNSALSLLTAFHKFSCPALTYETVSLVCSFVVAVALCSTSEDDVVRCLEHIDTVVKFGYVPKERLEEVVELVARVIGAENRIEVIDVDASTAMVDESAGLLTPTSSAASPTPSSEPRFLGPAESNRFSHLHKVPLQPQLLTLAKTCMKNLIRSPANQAVRSLRCIISSCAPPASEALGFVDFSAPPDALSSPSFGKSSCDATLVLGALRCLRDALEDLDKHGGSFEGFGRHNVGGGGWGDQYPTLLSLGLPLLLPQLEAALRSGHLEVEAEVLVLVGDRLAAAENERSIRMKEKDGGDRERPVSPVSMFDEWDATLEIMKMATEKLEVWEAAVTGSAKSWTLHVDDSELPTPATSPGALPFASPAASTNPGSPLMHFTNIFARLVNAHETYQAPGPVDKLSALYLSVCSFLSDSLGVRLVDHCVKDHLCVPDHPQWLVHLNKLTRAFIYERDPAVSVTGGAAGLGVSISGGMSKQRSGRPPAPRTSARVMRLIADTYLAVRDLDPWRDQLLEELVLPLISRVLNGDGDQEVGAIAVEILRSVASDELLRSLVEDPTSRRSTEGTQAAPDLFGRLHKLLLGIASAPTTSALFGASPISSAKPEQKGLSPHGAAVHQSVLGLIGLFNDSLVTATRYSALRCVDLFQDLLSLLSPAIPANGEALHGMSHDLKPLTNPLPTATRLAILQWAMRLRADQEHRVQFVKESDVSGLASVLQRVSSDPGHPATSVSNTASVDHRGRIVRPRMQSPGVTSPDRGLSSRRGRTPSLSRAFAGRDRSPSKPRKTTSVTSDPLWSIPETLPDPTWPDLISPESSDSLVSFDHRKMHHWQETTDSANLEYPSEPLPPTKSEMVVLPVSEYLTALIRLLRYEQDWELLSYVLCYLPDQLSNKHFACGPRAAQQIHQLRRLLCTGIAHNSLIDQAILPGGIKRTDAYAVSYQLLATLIAYRSLFEKRQQDEMVFAFVRGLGTSGDTAKACIHAIAMACHELQPSTRKFLPEILTNLAHILSVTSTSVHILELIASMAQIPTLYANLTESDFQTIFGIAIQYISIHNQNMLDEARKGQPTAESEVDEATMVASAFQQYVYLLAYYIIALWFVSLRLSERRKHVSFIVGRLVNACHGQTAIDEATEVCLDMIARYAYSNAEPRPRPSFYADAIASSLGQSTVEKAWVTGNAIVSIKSLSRPGWAEVSVRRPSGLVRMMWELENLGGRIAASEVDVLNMVLRHRDTVLEPQAEPTEEDRLLGQWSEGLSRRRAASFSGVRAAPPLNTALERITLETVLARSTAAAGLAPSFTELVAAPSFFSLQMSAFPNIGGDSAPLKVPDDPAHLRLIAGIDRVPVVDFHKVSVVYVGPGQTTEREILSNVHGSKTYIRFLTQLGTLIRLKGCKLYYTGGLDTHNDLNGKWTYVWEDDITQIAFHVATLMPTHPDIDPACIAKKAPIGNDFVSIVFNESGKDYRFNTIDSQFNFINIIIEPHTPAGQAWSAPGMSNNIEFFKVSLQRRAGIPDIGPVGNFKMVSTDSLPHFVRQLALHANIFSQIYLAIVGVRTAANRPRHKIEYVSHWRERLRMINTLKHRLRPPAPEGEEAASRPIDVDLLSQFRDFSVWTE